MKAQVKNDRKNSIYSRIGLLGIILTAALLLVNINLKSNELSEKLENYKDFGGIRIEDDLLITEDGCRILGRPIPKTVAEVEDMCAQGREWIKMTAMY